VLLAEDNAVMRTVLAEFIEREPTLELTAVVTDAAQAIAAATSKRPAVALLDVRMPGGGAMAARGIKRCSPETRVLALSVDGRRARVVEMLEAGADGYLVKDTPFAAIVTAITRAAAGRSTFSAEISIGVGHELAQWPSALRNRRKMPRSRGQRAPGASRDAILGAVFEPICTLAGRRVGAEVRACFAGGLHQASDGWSAEAPAAGREVQLELATARAAFAALASLPEPLYVTIGVSQTTLERDAFRRLLDEADGARVVVEIAGHSGMEHCEGQRGVPAMLRARGVRLAVGSIGVLACARDVLQLAPEFIKLDPSLVAGIEHPGPRQALAAALIAFGEKIDATVIAQGVERTEQLMTLCELGVRYGQGNLLSPSAPHLSS
jgi:DNA-binding NarL/FixJ family response regulator